MAADDAWTCCYVLVAGRSAADVAALLGGHLRGPLRSEREAARSSAAWPAIGAASTGWTLLVDPHFEFGDAEKELRDWSSGTKVVCLQVVEQSCFSHAVMWTDGTLAWEMSFERELDHRPLAGGRLPFGPYALARKLGHADDPHTWYRLPIAAVELLTMWRPGRPEPTGQPSFAEVEYPRPAGVAGWVARALAGHHPDTGPD